MKLDEASSSEVRFGVTKQDSPGKTQENFFLCKKALFVKGSFCRTDRGDSLIFGPKALCSSDSYCRQERGDCCFVGANEPFLSRVPVAEKTEGNFFCCGKKPFL